MTLEVDASQEGVESRRVVLRPSSRVHHRCDGTPSNAELIAGCRRGDPTAWNRLVDRYERLVYAIPLREGLNAADAAEISQATFETLIESLHRIRDPERLGYWLMTVARRFTWRRRDVLRAEVSVDVLPPDLTDHGLSTDLSTDWVRAVEVYDAVAMLAEPCRSLIVGLFFDPAEPSYQQLSDRLGIAIGSIGPTRSRCLDRLRERLES